MVEKNYSVLRVFRRKQAVFFLPNCSVIIKMILDPEKFTECNTKLPLHGWCLTCVLRAVFSAWPGAEELIAASKPGHGVELHCPPIFKVFAIFSVKINFGVESICAR